MQKGLDPSQSAKEKNSKGSTADFGKAKREFGQALAKKDGKGKKG